MAGPDWEMLQETGGEKFCQTAGMESGREGNSWRPESYRWAGTGGGWKLSGLITEVNILGGYKYSAVKSALNTIIVVFMMSII